MPESCHVCVPVSTTTEGCNAAAEMASTLALTCAIMQDDMGLLHCAPASMTTVDHRSVAVVDAASVSPCACKQDRGLPRLHAGKHDDKGSPRHGSVPASTVTECRCAARKWTGQRRVAAYWATKLTLEHFLSFADRDVTDARLPVVAIEPKEVGCLNRTESNDGLLPAALMNMMNYYS